MGRNAGGVKAIELAEGDEVVGLARTEPERQLVLAVCERGYGKRTALEEFRPQNRGGKGIILIDASDRNGPVVGIALVKPEDEVMLITDRGQTIRTPVDGIRETGRNAQGVKVMSVDDDERVVAFESIGESRAGAVLDGSIPPPPGRRGRRRESDERSARRRPERGRRWRAARLGRSGRSSSTPDGRAAKPSGSCASAMPTRIASSIIASPFELIVATVLSAQSTDVMVNKVTPELFRRWPTPDALAKAKPAEVEQVIGRLGFFRQKTKNDRRALAEARRATTAARCRRRSTSS